MEDASDSTPAKLYLKNEFSSFSQTLTPEMQSDEDATTLLPPDLMVLYADKDECEAVYLLLHLLKKIILMLIILMPSIR